MHDEDSDPNDPTKHDAIYSALYTTKRGKQQALLFNSTITTSTNRRPRDAAVRPGLLWRIPIEWTDAKAASVQDVVVGLRPHLTNPGKTYFNELEGYTFFMDGNARAKRIGKSLGVQDEDDPADVRRPIRSRVGEAGRAQRRLSSSGSSAPRAVFSTAT